MDRGEGKAAQVKATGALKVMESEEERERGEGVGEREDEVYAHPLFIYLKEYKYTFYDVDQKYPGDD